MSGSRRSVGSMVTPSDQSGTRLDMPSLGETGDLVSEPGEGTTTIRGGPEMLRLDELV